MCISDRKKELLRNIESLASSIFVVAWNMLSQIGHIKNEIPEVLVWVQLFWYHDLLRAIARRSCFSVEVKTGNNWFEMIKVENVACLFFCVFNALRQQWKILASF